MPIFRLNLHKLVDTKPKQKQAVSCLLTFQITLKMANFLSGRQLNLKMTTTPLSYIQRALANNLISISPCLSECNTGAH